MEFLGRSSLVGPFRRASACIVPDFPAPSRRLHGHGRDVGHFSE